MAPSKTSTVNCCAYRGCTNRRGDEGVVLFSCPKKGTEKFARWIEKSGVDPHNIPWRIMICNAHFRSEHFTTPEHERLLISNSVEPVDYREVDTSRNLNFDREKAVRVYNSNKAVTATLLSNIDFHHPSPVKDMSEIQTDTTTEEEMIIIHIPSPPATLPEDAENVEEELEEFDPEDIEEQYL